jgi:hypothetical protein
MNYEECFSLQQWIGYIKFTKNKSADIKMPFIHVSSVITMEQSTLCYHEQFDYVMFQQKVPYLSIHHFWKKNKNIILPNEIPPQLFQYIAQKRPSHTIYSSHPHHL